MEYSPVIFGDGSLENKGWLVMHKGAIRGILLEHGQGYILNFAYDKSIQLVRGHPMFNDWRSATSWLEGRLAVEELQSVLEPEKITAAPSAPSRRNRVTAADR